MKNILQKITKKFTQPKVFVSAVLSVLVLTGGALFAFGPERPVYDWNNPADRGGSFVGPVFNSFINTPTYGDERNFGRIAPVTPGQSPVQANFSEEITAEAGKEYWVRTFVHNGANQNTNCLENEKDTNGRCTTINPNAPGVAKNTRVRIAIAEGMANGVDVMSYISADNAVNKNGQPMRTVWDPSTLVNDNQRFSVSYVPGSAVLYNPAHQNGLNLPNGDAIVSAAGVPIGYDQMNGNVPGCFEFSAYVYVKVKVDVPKLEITKQVRKSGEKKWQESVATKPGDTVQWLVKVVNTGTTNQTNVVASDLLPPHLTYVPDTAKFYTASQNGTAYNFDQFIINQGKGGYIFGSFSPGGDLLIRFDTKVKDDFSSCEVTIRNIAHTKSDQQQNELQDFADVKITKENCKPTTPVTPVTTPPRQIPDTGAGSIAGLFVGTSVLGAAVHRIVSRRFGR